MKNLKLELEVEIERLGFYKSPTDRPLDKFNYYLVFDEYKDLKFICGVYKINDEAEYELFELIPANNKGRGIRTWDFERAKKFVDYLNGKEK